MTGSTTNLTNRRTLGKATTTKQIFSLNDFPDPVGGVITLEAAVAYQISGTVAIGTNEIRFNGANTIFGEDPFNDVLTCTTTGSFFTGINDNAFFSNLSVSCPNGTVYDFKNTAGNEKTSVFASNSMLVTGNKLGIFENMRVVGFFSAGTFSVNDGFSFAGSQNGIFVNSFFNITALTGTNSAFDFGTAIFDLITITNQQFINTATSTWISGAAGNANLSSGGSASVTQNFVQGSAPNLSGIAVTDSKWFFSNNPGLANSELAAVSLDISGDAVIDGNLLVSGTTTFIDVDNLSVTDQYIQLSAGYEVETGRTLGTFGPFLPLSTNDTVSSGAFVAGVASTSNPTVTTVGSATFTAAQIIQIAGTNNNENDGIYEVLTHVGTTLTIKGIGTTATVEDFSRNQFVANASDSATIRNVTVTILRADTAGVWETGIGSTTGITYTDLGGVSTSATLTDNFLVRGNGASDIDIGNIFMSSDGNDLTVPGIVTLNPSSTTNSASLFVTAAYDLTNASFDSVFFSIASQETAPTSIAFDTTGIRMYIIGFGNDTVFQYTLVVPFDISTASFASLSFSVSSEDTAPMGIVFNTAGTKMYMIGSTNNTIFQYTLSTAFTVSSASFDSVSFSVSSQDTAASSMAFNTLGTKMYICGTSSDAVHQYTLTSGFDLSTASSDGVSFSVSSQDSAPTSVTFNADGSKMFIVGSTNDTVFQYTLSTPFIISSASFDSISLSVTSQDTSPTGMRFNADGTKMYVIGSQNDRVYQYTLDIDGLNVVPSTGETGLIGNLTLKPATAIDTSLTFQNSFALDKLNMFHDESASIFKIFSTEEMRIQTTTSGSPTGDLFISAANILELGASVALNIEATTAPITITTTTAALDVSTTSGEVTLGSTSGNVTLSGSGAGFVTVSPTIRTGFGTELLPAYTFTGDIATGMRRSAASTLNFSAGGLDVVQMTADATATNFLTFNAVNDTGANQGNRFEISAVTSDAEGNAAIDIMGGGLGEIHINVKAGSGSVILGRLAAGNSGMVNIQGINDIVGIGQGVASTVPTTDNPVLLLGKDSGNFTSLKFQSPDASETAIIGINNTATDNGSFFFTSTSGVIFQNNTDSLIGFQILDADGGTPIVNVDTINERVGFGTATPQTKFHLFSTVASQSNLTIENTQTNSFDGITLRRSSTEQWFIGLNGADSNADFVLRANAATNPLLIARANGAITFQNGTDSLNGFQVLDADGGTPVFNVDTINERVGIGISPSATLDVSGSTILTSNAAGIIPLSIKGASGQTAQLLVVKDNADFEVMSLSLSGRADFQANIDQVFAFRILSSVGTMFVVDTLEKMVGIGQLSPSATFHVESILADNASQQLVKYVTTGSNGGEVEFGVGNRTPEGNRTAAGGAVHYRDSGATSGSYESLESGTGTTWLKRSVVPTTIIEIHTSEQFEELTTTIATSTTIVVLASIVTAKTFSVNTGVVLVIHSTLGDEPFSLVYTGTGTFFSGAGSVRVKQATLVSASTGTLANLSGGGTFGLENTALVGWADLGSKTSGNFICRFVTFVSIGSGITLKDTIVNDVFNTAHFGVPLTSPLFTFDSVFPESAIGLSTLLLTLSSTGSAVDFSTNINDNVGINVSAVDAGIGKTFKQTTVSEVAITAVADASIANGTITAMADNGLSGTTVSSTSTYFNGESITISGTTSYNGVFSIFNVVASTSFDIQTAFVADDATGTTVTERIGLTVGGGHGIVAADSIKVKDTNFYNAFNTVLIAGATLITVDGDFISTNTGNIQRDVSLDQTDPRVNGSLNAGFPDSGTIACAHINNNSTVNGTIVNNVFTDMVFGTIGSALIASSTMQRWKLINELNGTFEYIGLQPSTGLITFDFTVVSSGGTVDFRFKWQKSITTTITASTIAFVNSNPDTITDSGNGFLTAGFAVEDTIAVSGTVSNNGNFTIASVTAGTITLVASDTLTAESAGSSFTINGLFGNLLDPVESLVSVASSAQSVTKTFPLTVDTGEFIKPQITRNSGASTITTSFATIYSTD